MRRIIKKPSRVNTRCIVYLLCGIICLFAGSVSYAADGFTEKDRERMIRMEECFEAMQKEIDTLSTLVYFIFAGVFGIIGLILWDRRSYIKPVKEDLLELYNILKEYARKQPEFAEILRQHKLL